MKKPATILLSAVLSASMTLWAVPISSVAYADAEQPANEQKLSAGSPQLSDSSNQQNAESPALANDAEAATTPTDENNASAATSSTQEDADSDNANTGNAAESNTAPEATAPEAATADPLAASLQSDAAPLAAVQPNYDHSTQASQNGVTFTVQWNDTADKTTTFHVTATGGSGDYKARMDVPTYWDSDGSQESVCDPSRGSWTTYTTFTDGEAGADFQFDFTASGTYRIYFYFMNTASGIYYLRATAEVTVNDPARPSVTQIVNDAVAQCKAETNGSEYDMALWLHDWAIDQLEYDRSLNWCSAESGLTRGLGTCESYQRIYAKLLNAAGIANGRIEGNGHTWNAVKIDGEWCQMDLTWDDSSDNWYGDFDQRHIYFGLSDELMAIAHPDHEATYQKEGYQYRSTGLTNNYFVRNGKADEWAAGYAERIQQHLDARETEFSIDADNAYWPPSISGIQNGIIAWGINQREWTENGRTLALSAKSSSKVASNSQSTPIFEFGATYQSPDNHNGYFTIQSALDGGSVIDIESGSLDPRANARLWTPNGTAAQVFRFRYDETSGGYEITNAKSGLALDVAGGVFEARQNIQQYTRNGTEAQRWTVLDNGDGTVTIALKSDERYVLDAKGGIGSAGTNVQLYGANSTKAQRWRLIEDS